MGLQPLARVSLTLAFPLLGLPFAFLPEERNLYLFYESSTLCT